MTTKFEKLFSPIEISNTTETTLFVLDVSFLGVLRSGRVRLVNTTATATTVSMWAIDSGDSPVDENKILSDFVVRGDNFIDVDLPIMQIGDTLKAKAGAANSITVSFINGFSQS
jgi:hypothetical protein